MAATQWMCDRAGVGSNSEEVFRGCVADDDAADLDVKSSSNGWFAPRCSATRALSPTQSSKDEILYNNNIFTTWHSCYIQVCVQNNAFHTHIINSHQQIHIVLIVVIVVEIVVILLFLLLLIQFIKTFINTLPNTGDRQQDVKIDKYPETDSTTLSSSWKINFS